MAFFSFWQAFSDPIYLKKPDVKLANCHLNELLADSLLRKCSKAFIYKGLSCNGLVKMH
jgi:hypothetical protein